MRDQLEWPKLAVISTSMSVEARLTMAESSEDEFDIGGSELGMASSPHELAMLPQVSSPKHRFEGPVGYRGMWDGPSRPNTLGKLERLA